VISVDPNCEGALTRERDYLTEAKKTPGCEELAAMLAGRVRDLEAMAEQERDAAKDLDKAEREHEAARLEFNRRDIAYVAGTVDAEEALALRDQRDIASARLRALGLPVATAKARLDGLRSKIVKRDAHRDNAESTTKRMMTACLRDMGRHLEIAKLAEAPAAERLWWPLHEARCLAAYHVEAQDPEFRFVHGAERAGVTSYGPPAVSELEALFRARRQAVEGRAAKLRNELAKLQPSARDLDGRAMASL
jgi:hypothetical protein